MEANLNIQFSGLKEGLHDFHFDVGNAFFEQLDYSEIQKAELSIDIQLEKQTNMLILNFEIKGRVMVMCDKCTDDFYLDINTNEELIYKFSDGFSDDEKIVFIPENEVKIDISQPIYELTITAIPSKRVHPDGKCNQEMLEAMDDYLMVETDEAEPDDDDTKSDDQDIDPRWEELKKLKK
ncbi:MAG: DUF177 domain-containing protein [Crocinitomicaceae bacterium]|nr:DUF177 domain-containing protein [Crocinitomicaceae bacterium]